MSVRKPVQTALLAQMRSNGGTLTVEKHNRLLRYTATALNRMADAGQVTLVTEDARSITYRLPLCQADLWPAQPVVWQHKGTAIPATVVDIQPQCVAILVRASTGEEKLHLVRLSTLQRQEDEP